jgi:hypothetical protein
MSFNIDRFRGALPSGGARPTLFRVDLNSPFTTGLNQLSNFLVQATSLPGSSIGNIPMPYMGRKINFAGDRTFDAWDVTVINDENFLIRDAMEEWHSRINSLLENVSSAVPERYKHDATVYQLAKNDGSFEASRALRSYKYIGLFPVEISPIELDWNDTDNIERFTVRFMYDYYQVDGTTDSGRVI